MSRNIIGERNPRWNGGVSEYPNHIKMKRNRLIKLKEADCKCEVCGKEAFIVHHLDESKDNHEIDNLAILCKRCHLILHANFRSTKYSRLYGMTMKQMVERYGGSLSKYWHLHKRGQLKEFLEIYQK